MYYSYVILEWYSNHKHNSPIIIVNLSVVQEMRECPVASRFDHAPGLLAEYQKSG